MKIYFLEGLRSCLHLTSDAGLFLTEGIDKLFWPARSLELMLLRMLGDLSRWLYAKGRHFDTIADLTEALYYEWDELKLSYI